MAFFLKALGLSGSIPGFPFTPATNDPGHTVYTSPQMCWTLRAGTQSDDVQTRVSIFTCSVSAAAMAGSSGDGELMKQLAQNTMRRAKSLMIPGFLKCHGAVEYSDTIYIATEPCVALKDVLESLELRRHYCGETDAEYAASVAYGLDTVGGALVALQSNRLAHGNVHCGSIFISAVSGFWRLFGLEFVSAIDEMASGSPGCLFASARRAGMVVGYRCPPELGRSSGGVVSSGDPEVAVDAWGFGCLLYETVGVTAEEAINGKLNSLVHNLSAADVRSVCRQRLPASLQPSCNHLTTPNPRMRHSITAFLENCEFVKKSAFVQYMKALSELLLMDWSQQMQLVESLADPVGQFPLRACLCFVLPRLGGLVSTAAKTNRNSGTMGVSIGPVADPVLKISERTAAGEDFDTYVTPVLVQLYQSADVLLRYKLLLGAETYSAKVSSTTLNNTIWPLYAKGFAYSAPSVREYSARALVHLAPHLSESILADQVPKALAQLQRDVDGALRANATIALNLISEHIKPSSQRATVMLMYCRPMLRDAFEPSRVAALQSLHRSLECLSATQIAESMLPAISPLTIDPSSAGSRTAALSLLKASMTRLEAHHKQLSAQQVCAAVNGNTDAPSTSTPVPAAVPTGTTSTMWSLLEGFTISSTLSAASTAPQNVDATSAPALLSVSGPLRPTPAPTVLPTPATCVASSVEGGSGWSDDDEVGAASEDDGEGRSKGFRERSPLANSALPTPSAPTAPFAGRTSASTAASYIASPVNTTGGAHRSASLTGFASSLPSQSPRTAPKASGAPSRPGIDSLVSGAGGAAPVSANGGTNAVTASASSGPMKLRRKGGLGAARLD
ncbi:hypothetical protein, conserved [Leishmania tarentolae]|uniref:Protein kinase domain-containing protein n=1 Tax=Leishmania tarentolae TaxID=5689 RepID=A0A640KFL7_LEITA|nr:hypothetical protein, conserved [Leishmania tarentolae]